MILDRHFQQQNKIDDNIENHIFAASALMENYWWLFWCCNAMMEIMKTMEAPESLSSDRLHNKLRVLVVRALPHLKLWHCLDYLCHCHHLHHRDDFNDDDNDDGHLHGTELHIVLLLLLSSSPPAPLLTHRVEDAVVRPEQQRSCLLSFSFSILCFFPFFRSFNIHLILSQLSWKVQFIGKNIELSITL